MSASQFGISQSQWMSYIGTPGHNEQRAQFRFFAWFWVEGQDLTLCRLARTVHVSQTGLKLAVIILIQPPKRWDCKHALPYA